MNSVTRTLKQFADLFRSMSPSQRGTLIVVPLMLFGAFYFTVFRDSSGSYAAVSWGKVFTTEELSVAEQALIDAGLNDFRREGQRLMAPQADVEKYNAALAQNGGLPDNWTDEWEKQFEKTNFMSSSTQVEKAEAIARRTALNRMIRAIPDIQDANVIWDGASTKRFGRRSSKVTAAVMVKPKGGRELSLRTIESIRVTVASAIADLSPSDVVVTNLANGTAYKADDEQDQFHSKFLERKQELTRDYERRMSAALDYIQNVVVTVGVEIDEVRRNIEQSRTPNPKSVVPVHTVEDTTKELFKEQPSRGEPGVGSNAPRSVNVAGGTDRTRESTNKRSETSSETAVTVTSREWVDSAPKSVRVDVAIPDDHYRSVAVKLLKQGAGADAAEPDEAAITAKVAEVKESIDQGARDAVSKLLPNDSAPDAVTVHSYNAVEPEGFDDAIPLTEKATNAVTQWGGAIGLGFFAIWSLWMLNKSTPKPPPMDPEPVVAEQRAAGDESAAAKADEKPHVSTPRDELQQVVKDNPEAAALVLKNWIKTKT